MGSKSPKDFAHEWVYGGTSKNPIPATKNLSKSQKLTTSQRNKEND